ncbi:hypothetical protein [Bacillus methanolicus]|uniref:Putative membrane protein n=1 Tax=Bacillus methanolicus (strain MGA3 / ATCC 53907) TaxID=796606 RepID=I3DTF4_BACMM|nr:hypothetical protein [Bacillus methanolicus]AIE61748.1 putative membrane protein [Bacillus methanolicus MGA3]EIJ77525.1 hypothetical protein MGA3_17547 [Bacillus methanolicus MGA3]
MERVKSCIKVISLLIAIVIVWFFLFGIRLIGYFLSISERGLRATECGTQGCSDFVFLWNTAWTFTFLIVIPLIIPSVLVIYWSLKNNKRSS